MQVYDLCLLSVSLLNRMGLKIRDYREFVLRILLDTLDHKITN